MAVNRVDFPTAGAPVATSDYVKTLANLSGALTGPGEIPITNFGTTSTPQIAISALFVAGGTLYQADSDTSISGTMANERYIEMVPSGSPTGATLTPTWTATAPTWDTAQDHFVAASGNLVLHVMRDSYGYNGHYVSVENDIYKRKTLAGKWSSCEHIGSQATITTGGQAQTICSLSRNNGTIVHVDATSDVIQAYQWNGRAFSTEGNSIACAWSNISGQIICRLSDSTIAAVIGSNLRKLSFDGTDWSVVGNTLSMTNTIIICELEDDRIFFYDKTAGEIGTYEFGGTDWSKTFSDTFIAAAGASISGCSQMGVNRVAFFDDGTDLLRCFIFDGANWLQEGSTTSLTGESLSLTTADNNTICTHDTASETIKIYNWEGSSFTQNGNYLDTGLSMNGVMASIAYMGGSDFVLSNGTAGGDCYLNYFRAGFSVSTMDFYE